ncbi:MAG: hypothetical protein AAF995_11215 [Planctomycetota bacterium]
MPPPERRERDLFGKVPKDRADWSHRRGEPRLFAVGWMVFLMGASGLVLAGIGAATHLSPHVAAPAARGALVAIAIGIGVLWPMLRLSQVPPDRRRVLREVLRDLLVMVPPAAAVVLPQSLPFLANWPIEVILSVVALLAAWSLVAGGLVALGYATARADGTGRSGTIWMLAVVALVAAGPIVLGVRAPARDESARPVALVSPVSGVMELTRPRPASGSSAAVSGEHWRAIGWVALSGAGLLAGGVGLSRGRGSA